MIAFIAKIEDYMLPCLNKRYLGFECMGCGLQRSAALMIRGDFVDAFFMYPAIYPLLFFFSLIVVNLFRKIKHFNSIITILALFTVVTIVISFIIKRIIN